MPEGYAEVYVTASLSGYIRVPIESIPENWEDDDAYEQMAEEWLFDSLDSLDLSIDSVDDVIRTDDKGKVTHRMTEDGWKEVKRSE